LNEPVYKNIEKDKTYKTLYLFWYISCIPTTNNMSSFWTNLVEEICNKQNRKLVNIPTEEDNEWVIVPDFTTNVESSNTRSNPLFENFTCTVCATKFVPTDMNVSVCEGNAVCPTCKK